MSVPLSDVYNRMVHVLSTFIRVYISSCGTTSDILVSILAILMMQIPGVPL